jgi:hypothetical protein
VANAQKVLTGVTLAIAALAHAFVGLFILASGLVAHPALWLSGLVAWALGAYLIGRWRGRPARIILVPLSLAGAYLLALLVGERMGFVGA